MISVEAYRGQVVALAAGRTPSVETVPVEAAAGRVLAEDVSARFAVPPFDNSAMDGFAVRAEDVAGAPVVLPVIGESAAASGSIPEVRVGSAVRVMTGGRLPLGADAVVPVELTDQPSGAAVLPVSVRIEAAVAAGANVRRRAEDLAEGATVLRAGDLVGAAAIAAAASVGHGRLQVRRRPRVAVVSTGAELVQAGLALEPGQIPDSNSPMLAALAAAAGAEVVASRRSGDDPAALAALLRDLPEVDAIFTSGGLSAGAYEPVRQLGGTLDFCSVAMQPGKPQGCGLLDGVPLVAFPGNPVSVFVSFHVFGGALLDALGGATRRRSTRFGLAAQAWASPFGRRQYLPVIEDGNQVMPSHIRGSGSHLIASLHLADALAIVPEEQTAVMAGERLELMQV